MINHRDRLLRIPPIDPDHRARGRPPVSDFGQLQRPQSSGVLMVRRGDDHLIGVSFVHRLGEIGHDPFDSYIIIIY